MARALSGERDAAALEARLAARLDAYFTGLRGWHAALARAWAFVTGPARADLPASSALAHVETAAYALPAWPLALETLEGRLSVEAALDRLGAVAGPKAVTARKSPGPLHVVQPGRARDVFEADRHALAQRCLWCGGALMPSGEQPLPPPFALAKTLRCAACDTPVRYEYLAGWRWHARERLSSLARAAAAEPSLLFTASDFAALAEHAHRELSREEALASAPQRRRVLAESGLVALWELAKLPDVPEALRGAGATTLERELADAWRTQGGTLPAFPPAAAVSPAVLGAAGVRRTRGLRARAGAA